MTYLDPDFDDVDWLIKEMKESGEWQARVEEPEAQEEQENGPA